MVRSVLVSAPAGSYQGGEFFLQSSGDFRVLGDDIVFLRRVSG